MNGLRNVTPFCFFIRTTVRKGGKSTSVCCDENYTRQSCSGALAALCLLSSFFPLRTYRTISSHSSRRDSLARCLLCQQSAVCHKTTRRFAHTLQREYVPLPVPSSFVNHGAATVAVLVGLFQRKSGCDPSTFCRTTPSTLSASSPPPRPLSFCKTELFISCVVPLHAHVGLVALPLHGELFFLLK